MTTSPENLLLRQNQEDFRINKTCFMLEYHIFQASNRAALALIRPPPINKTGGFRNELTIPFLKINCCQA